MNHLKHLIICFIVLSVFSVIGHSQDIIPYKNGKLHGDFSVHDSINQTITSGTFKNNTRSGEWTITNGEGKIVYQRKYDSYFSFDEKKIYHNKASHSKYKHPIERNDNELYIYPEISNSNVLWSKRVWSILPEKHHGQLYSQEVLIKISDWVKEGKLKVYNNDEMSSLLSGDRFDVRNQKIEGVSIKKDYFFNKPTHLMQERIVAINFHLERDETGNNQTFSIYYPTDGRALLSTFDVSNEFTKIEHYDDLFFFQNYVDVIYKEESKNTSSRKPNFSEISKYQKKSDAIRTVIITEEHKYWLKD